MITSEQKKALMDAIKSKASHNKQGQAYISPSDFGFGRKPEDTEECASFLRKKTEIESVKIIGKDLLDISIKIMEGEK